MPVAQRLRTDDRARDLTASPDNKISAELARLQTLTVQELRSEWRRLSRTQPPRLSRDLMIRALAYRLQERAHGGLSKAKQRQLKTLAQAIQHNDDIPVRVEPHVRPGARLVREWHGRVHLVTVLEDGFAYGGQIYPSLSRIARVITGSHWSGPRFFGLAPPSACSAKAGRRRYGGSSEATDG